jgi:hypothetical protein
MKIIGPTPRSLRTSLENASNLNSLAVRGEFELPVPISEQSIGRPSEDGFVGL